MPVYRLKIGELDQEFIEKLQKEFEDAEIEIRVHPLKTDSSSMNEIVFWHVISLLDWDQDEDDNEAILEPAIIYLSNLNTKSIYVFQDILSKKLYQLDKKEYAENMGEDAFQPDRPFSPDYFLYARACVVANGKDYYESVLADPTQMLKGYTFESLLFLAGKAFKRKTGKTFDYHPAISYETFSNPEGWSETLQDKLLGQGIGGRIHR